MLAAAAAKTGPGIPPVFLHQSMPQLDLYGTVDAAICCLDSLNYLTNPRDVQRTFERLHLFIAPGGTLIFDVNTPEKFLRLDRAGLPRRDGGRLLCLAHGVQPRDMQLLCRPL